MGFNGAMTANLPEALASVLSALERDQLRYVLYRDPKSSHRVVMMVEGPQDAARIESALREAGAESAAGDAGNDFLLTSRGFHGNSDQTIVIELKTGTGKATTIANLLWLAATSEGAAAARNSVDPDSKLR